MKRKMIYTLSLALGLALTGCGGISMPSFGTSPSTSAGGQSAASGEHFIHNGHDFGANRHEEYKKGVVDGCKTAHGEYTKNHDLFQSSDHYRAGWEHGRLHCVKGTPAHD